VGHGLFIGFLGNGGINAPLYVYVSRWFDRRRGSALALISSGAYVAGAVWPPIFERAIAAYGWQQTMWAFGLVEMAVIVPLAAMFLRPLPDSSHVRTGAFADPRPGPVLGWPPNLVYSMLCAAAFLCCIPMALPQAHLVAFCSDLGISPAHGAAMLSVVLGCGVLSRQIWGLFSDRAGGLATLAVCSACQATALGAFLMTQDEIGLFTVSALFGLGFSGLVPAYVLTLRELYPARDARWRVPTSAVRSKQLRTDAVPIGPVCCLEFPDNREINRDFEGFQAPGAMLASDYRTTSMICNQIPTRWSREFRRGNREFLQQSREANRRPRDGAFAPLAQLTTC
jgi:MFS family permease